MINTLKVKKKCAVLEENINLIKFHIVIKNKNVQFCLNKNKKN